MGGSVDAVGRKRIAEVVVVRGLDCASVEVQTLVLEVWGTPPGVGGE